jgi:predicted CXXCH cytochrome family protein
MKIRPVLFSAILLPALWLSGAPQKSARTTKQAMTVAGAPADAEAVGDETCAGCHAELATSLALSTHGRLKDFELRGTAGRCESCHGLGSKHAESADAALINSFKAEAAERSTRACMSCHSDGMAMDWKGSEHAMAGVTCSSCHRVHQSRRAAGSPLQRSLAGANPVGALRSNAPPPRASLVKPEPELCYDCHRQQRAQMNYSSHHPVREGRMNCSSCHNTHGSQSEHLLRNAESEKAFCANCHPNKQGPFVFEHAAVEEGCNVCHTPHGSVAGALLKQNEPYLCLQCHEAHFHIGREGVTTAVRQPTGGSSNPNGVSGWRQAFTTKCTQCHSQIHGSDLPSQSTTSRGRSLTR